MTTGGPLLFGNLLHNSVISVDLQACRDLGVAIWPNDLHIDASVPG